MAPGRGIWVNVPYGVSGTLVKKFIEEKKEWILHHKSMMKDYERETGVGITIGSEIKTKLYTLHIEETKEQAAYYQIKENRVFIFIPKFTPLTDIDHIVKNFLLIIYRKECLSILPERVASLAGKYDFKYQKLSFRNNISNWGSCTYDNCINLNIKLMKLPDEVIDYVILHELCHTVEKNHSESFWQLVEKVCPEYKKLRAELKKFTTRL